MVASALLARTGRTSQWNKTSGLELYDCIYQISHSRVLLWQNTYRSC